MLASSDFATPCDPMHLITKLQAFISENEVVSIGNLSIRTVDGPGQVDRPGRTLVLEAEVASTRYVTTQVITGIT